MDSLAHCGYHRLGQERLLIAGMTSIQNSRSETSRFRASVGIVLIGRNEGERLKACIQSVVNSGALIVYVDSGSTDGSPQFAASHGVEVVDLDLSKPFTAARARNAGFQKLDEMAPELFYVHFIDGDCILEPAWLSTAVAFMDDHPKAAVVCGIRAEIYPDASIYNWICNLEWNQPAGETSACGGDALYRASAFRDVGGFDSSFLAAEEPELCARLRGQGWHIWRLPDKMTRHDAAMHRYSQFWKRATRSGYGESRLAFAHGSNSSGSGFIAIARPLLYAAIPVAALGLVFSVGLWGLLPLAIFPLQVARIASRLDISDLRCWKYAVLITSTKFAEAKGALAFLWDVATGRTRKIIEYK